MRRTVLRILHFPSAVSVPYLKRLVNHLCSKRKNCGAVVKEKNLRKIEFIFEKVLDFLSLLWCVVVLTKKEAQHMI